MLNILIRIVSKILIAHIAYIFMIKQGNFPKISPNTCFIELSEEFPRDLNTNSNQLRYSSH